VPSHRGPCNLRLSASRRCPLRCLAAPTRIGSRRAAWGEAGALPDQNLNLERPEAPGQRPCRRERRSARGAEDRRLTSPTKIGSGRAALREAGTFPEQNRKQERPVGELQHRGGVPACVEEIMEGGGGLGIASRRSLLFSDVYPDTWFVFVPPFSVLGYMANFFCDITD
jgi:hypothetical protein